MSDHEPPYPEANRALAGAPSAKRRSEHEGVVRSVPVLISGLADVTVDYKGRVAQSMMVE